MNRADARSYDLFKTIVAVILALILLLMLLRGCSTNAAAPAPTQVVQAQRPTETLPSSPVVTEQATEVVVTQTSTSSPEPTAVEPTTTPTTVAATATPTVAPSASTETATATPEQAVSVPTPNSSCNTTSPSRLSVGQTARVLQRLNVRSEASIRAAIITVHRTNTQMEVTGGPVCEPVGNHAYLWWQIRLPDGTQGWSAETPLNNTNYFLEPVQ
jgi:hypothetical protein